jgi:hypothetical protein
MKTEKKFKVIGAMKVTEDLHTEIVKTAEEDDRSIQDQVRFLIKIGLKERKKRKTEIEWDESTK